MEPEATAITDEGILLRQIRQGMPSAMKSLYGTYVRYLTAICSRYITNQEDVKDVLQESFLKIFAGIDNFEYRGEGSLRAWLARLTVNETLAFLKRNNRVTFVEPTGPIPDYPDEEPEADGIPADAIYNMIRSLPDGYRTIFNLYVIEGRSHKEIAAILGIKENSSASQLHRAKAMLAARIKEYHNSNTMSV